MFTVKEYKKKLLVTLFFYVTELNGMEQCINTNEAQKIKKAKFNQRNVKILLNI